MHCRRGIITDEVLESDPRRRTFHLRKWTAMNKFETSISKVGTSFRGLFFGKFGEKALIKTDPSQSDCLSTAYEHDVPVLGSWCKEGRILISPWGYLNRQYPLLELR